MKKASLYISILSLSTALVSCGGGNGGEITGAGERCKEDGTSYNPIPLETSSSKVSMKAEDKQLSQGQYVYAGSELYYYDSQSKTQVHISEDGSFKSKVVCVRNLPVGEKSIVEEKPMAASMSVQNNGTMDFEVRKLIFTFDKTNLTLVSQAATKGDFKTAEEVFVSKGSRMQFYKTSDSTFETRTTETIGSVRKDLVVRYTFKK